MASSTRNPPCAPPRALRRAVAVASRVAARAAAALAAAAMLGGCGASEPAESAAAETARVVSLSPAISASIAALGATSAVVGRTPWCAALPESIPVVGSLNDFDAERLVRCRPTHLVVQPPRTGLDPALAALAERRGWTVETFHLDGLQDIDRLLRELPAVLAAPGTPQRRELEARSEALRGAIDAALDARDAAVAQAGTVLLLASVDPPMAFGEGTYLAEILARLGGRNALDARGYPELSLEDIQRLEPQTIVVVRSGALAVDDAPLRRLDVPAVRSGRLLRLSHPEALLPGPAVGEVAEALRAVLRSAEGSGAAAEGGTP